MQRTMAAAFSCLLLSGCASMPEKPVVETGQLDIPSGHVLAGLTDGSDPIHAVPLTEYDKAQCFKPKAWESMKVYLKLLEAFAIRCHMAAGGDR